MLKSAQQTILETRIGYKSSIYVLAQLEKVNET